MKLRVATKFNNYFFKLHRLHPSWLQVMNHHSRLDTYTSLVNHKNVFNLTKLYLFNMINWPIVTGLSANNCICYWNRTTNWKVSYCMHLFKLIYSFVVCYWSFNINCSQCIIYFVARSFSYSWFRSNPCV
jgi:hypothetical protein